ncbi:GNAT family N-acetyltransferase [Luteimonas sp. MJ250]|uniref:GNAT family N-acetyltransferase n=1 Tax=Luteimonas sp. MJ250 TaxID=3129236 RepID=UPI0031BB5456
MRSSEETSPATEPRHWIERLSDGCHVIIRPLCRSDEDAERAFIKSLSPESRRARFLGHVSERDDALITKLLDIDQVNDVAVAAFSPDMSGERIVGVSRYSVGPDKERCECAVVVADDWQRKGLGSALMGRLIEIAKRSGLRSMDSFDLANNRDMHDLAKRLGFSVRSDTNDPRQVIYTLRLDDSLGAQRHVPSWGNRA